MPHADRQAAARQTVARRVELHLAAAQVPDAFAMWHAALAGMFDVKLADATTAGAFRGGVVGFHLGDCLTFNNASVGQHLIRTPALARGSGLDHVMIQYQTSGHLRGDYDGRAIDLRPGDIGFLDFTGSTASSETDFSRITLIVPRERLPRSLSERDLHGVVLDRDEIATSVLARYMSALWRSASSLTELQAAAAVDAALGLADIWRAPGLDPERLDATGATVRAMADAYIDAHLSDPDLAPAAIAAALQLSRTSLYRLFDDDGGVRSFVVARRLDRCLVALVKDTPRLRSIASVAFAHGFSSEAHFSRAFRRRFGISARDLRGELPDAAADDLSSPAAAATLREWMTRLGAEPLRTL